MIQANLEALPAYTCASTMLTPGISSSLDYLHRKFFWRENKKRNATPLIAWDTICRPKSQGGLGLRKTLPMNKAFIAKLGWKILTEPHNFWVKLISDKYFHNQSFFNCKPKPNDSHIWRKIILQRPLLHKGIRWKIGDGSQILFWLHNWCLKENLMTVLKLNENQVDVNLLLKDFILLDKFWGLLKLKTFLPDHIIKCIKGIPLPSTPLADEPFGDLVLQDYSQLIPLLGWLITSHLASKNGITVGFGISIFRQS